MLRSLKLKLDGPKLSRPPLNSDIVDASPRQPQWPKGSDGGRIAANGDERSMMFL